jgi:hypothetical protein
MRPVRPIVVTALVLALCACESAGRPTAPARVNAPALSTQRLSPQFVPAFDALQAALDAGDTRLARHILARIWMRHPKGATRELAAGFERIVSGRECAASLDLALECRPVADDESAAATRAGSMRVVLRASSTSRSDFVLRPGPASLVITRTAVDARGNEQSSVEMTACGEIPALEFSRGATLETELTTFALPLPQAALAVRVRVELDLRSGTFLREKKELPAQKLRVAAGEANTRAPALEAAGPASPSALLELAQPGKFTASRALEIAVRVPPADRARALDALWPLVDTLPEVDVKRLVPSLRWLALTSQPGGGAEAWRAYLRARSAARTPGPLRERLDLPNPQGADEAQTHLALEHGAHSKD